MRKGAEEGGRDGVWGADALAEADLRGGGNPRAGKFPPPRVRLRERQGEGTEMK